MIGHDPSPGLVVARAGAGRRHRHAGGAGRDPASGADRRGRCGGDGRADSVPSRAESRELVSRDGSSALILGHFAHTDQADLEDAAERIPPKLRSDELDLTVGGFAVGFNDVNDTVREDLERAELIAFPILAILLAARVPRTGRRGAAAPDRRRSRSSARSSRCAS